MTRHPEDERRHLEEIEQARRVKRKPTCVTIKAETKEFTGRVADDFKRIFIFKFNGAESSTEHRKGVYLTLNKRSRRRKTYKPVQ